MSTRSCPRTELKKIVEECEPALAELTEKLKEAIHDASEAMSKTQQFFGRLMGKQKVEPETVRQELSATRRHAFLAIVRIAKRYPKISVYLEFEDLVPVDDRVRHYAFPHGEHGVALLPMLVQLPEDKDEFDIRSVRKVIDFDIFKAAQRWGLEANAAS